MPTQVVRPNPIYCMMEGGKCGSCGRFWCMTGISSLQGERESELRLLMEELIFLLHGRKELGIGTYNANIVLYTKKVLGLISVKYVICNNAVVGVTHDE